MLDKRIEVGDFLIVRNEGLGQRFMTLKVLEEFLEDFLICKNMSKDTEEVKIHREDPTIVEAYTASELGSGDRTDNKLDVDVMSLAATLLKSGYSVEELEEMMSEDLIHETVFNLGDGKLMFITIEIL